MEPVAKRTRRQRHQELIQKYWENNKHKKRNTSDDEEIMRMGVISTDQKCDTSDYDDSTSESESETENAVLRKRSNLKRKSVKKDQFFGNAREEIGFLDLSEGSESESEFFGIKLETLRRKRRKLVISESEEEEDCDIEIGSINNPIDVEDDFRSIHGKKGKNVREFFFNQSTKRRHGYDDILEDQSDAESVELVIEPSLPLKFTFGVQGKIPADKSDEEKEIDRLWAEMGIALYSVGACDDPNVYQENETTNGEPTSAAANCHRGKHCLVLDEEIGFVCKFCFFVDDEIRYYTVPFCKNPLRNLERQGSSWEKDDHKDMDSDHRDMDSDTEDGLDYCSHEEGKVWGIIPGILKGLHKHQRDGFEFLWKNIGGSTDLDKLTEPTGYNSGCGCIISHAPGTGKTRLAIVFLQTYMKLYPTCRPLIIAPTGLLLVWEEEFKKWNFKFPFHNMNQQKHSVNENRTVIRSGSGSKYMIRREKLKFWLRKSSVLGISYSLFEQLVKDDHQMQNTRKVLLERPDLLLLDEGHTPRNDKSLIFKALSKIETRKRIILSGTPFQNNFNELFNTFCLVRPEFADSLSGSRAKSRKNWNSLTNSIGKERFDDIRAEKNLEELQAMIRPFVHVHRGDILQKSLPGIIDSVIILEPGQLQKDLLERIRGLEKVDHLQLEYWLSLASVHPSLVPNHFPAELRNFDCLKMNPGEGVKTKFLMELIRISQARDEKVLIFSQYLEPLDLMGKQLAKAFKWIEGREILQMQGSDDSCERYAANKRFNDPKSESKVMLASIKACSEGISLIGASQVVLLDVVWNPSVERQAISRAFRLGQKKIVHVYHLIMSGKEEEKFSRQGEKERLSNLVFFASEKNQKRTDERRDAILEAIVDSGKLKDILKDIR